MRTFFFGVAALSCLGTGAGVAAQAPSGCEPVLAANDKLTTTPHHIFTTQALAGRTIASETVTVGDVSYVLVQGRWSRSPTTPRARLQEERENLRRAKSYSCQVVRDESVDGVAATIYRTRSESSDAAVSDVQVWIAKSAGLPLKREIDTGREGRPATMHLAQRFEYVNVQIPPGVK
ncbi:MAG: hypothetical protein ABIT71_25970 [Vicinamibacteraceae bacterium]